jgi:transposase
METTGIYHEQAVIALADAGVTVSIINPAQVKDFGRGLAVRAKANGGNFANAVLACATRGTPASLRMGLGGY